MFNNIETSKEEANGKADGTTHKRSHFHYCPGNDFSHISNEWRTHKKEVEKLRGRLLSNVEGGLHGPLLGM
jgi:hypothetical protein